MKIFLAIVMTLSLSATAWSACDEKSPGECSQDACTKLDQKKVAWKAEDSKCVAITNPQGGETTSVCAAVDGSTKGKGGDGAASTGKTDTGSAVSH